MPIAESERRVQPPPAAGKQPPAPVPGLTLMPRAGDPAPVARLMSELAALRVIVDMQRARIAELEELADRDALAPIVNRRAFVRELARAVALNRRYGANACVIYFDLNGLKAINDSFGHAAGDAAILRVAETLRQNVRDSDLVGRLGGDEFGVLMPQAEAGAAEEKAASLSERVERTPLEWAGSVIPLRLAYGVHVIASGQDASDALAAADMAMYAHKRRA